MVLGFVLGLGEESFKAADGTVKGNGFYGFNGTDANVVLNNSGNLNIENSVFKLNKHNDTQQNSAYGSVIYNSSTGIGAIIIFDSNFIVLGSGVN